VAVVDEDTDCGGLSATVIEDFLSGNFGIVKDLSLDRSSQRMGGGPRLLPAAAAASDGDAASSSWGWRRSSPSSYPLPPQRQMMTKGTGGRGDTDSNMVDIILVLSGAFEDRGDSSARMCWYGLMWLPPKTKFICEPAAPNKLALTQNSGSRQNDVITISRKVMTQCRRQQKSAKKTRWEPYRRPSWEQSIVPRSIGSSCFHPNPSTCM